MAHIRDISVKNFRRFTDLKIQEIPSSARLVVLVGPNGSGKSAIFDAINQWYRTLTNYGLNNEGSYYSKIVGSTLSVFPTVNLHEVAAGESVDMNGLVHIRSAYRIDADFTLNHISAVPNRGSDPRVQRMIDIDQSVALNYQLMVSDVVTELFNIDSQQSVMEFREELIGDLRDRVLAVFSDLKLKSLGRPLDNGSFYFEKGIIDSFHYKNLSGGEKSVFDILLDLHIATRVRRDRIFIIDEPELHTNSRIQRDLMCQMFDLIPDESQMWISTHSLGMLNAAKRLSEQHPGKVCFLSLYDHDSDGAVILRPIETDRKFWSRVFSETLDEFVDLVAPSEVIICEGGKVSTGEEPLDLGFDAKCYNAIFGKRYPDSMFVSMGSSSEVAKSGKWARQLILSMTSGVSIRRLVDRDDMNESEIRECRAEGMGVLNRREIESYIINEEIIRKLCDVTGNSDRASDAWQVIETHLLKVRGILGVATDEVKAASNAICADLKKLLSLANAGKKSSAFMLELLVPLITPETQAYQELERSIWWEICD